MTDATAKGKPDIEAVNVIGCIITLNEVLEVTTKLIVYNGDTGGGGWSEYFIFMVKTLER